MIVNIFELTRIPIFPAGFDMVSSDPLGLFMDSPVLHFLNTFGVLGGVLILGFILVLGVGFWVKKIGKPMCLFDQIAVYFVPLQLPLLILNGRFTYITYDAALFGLVLGRWFTMFNFGSVSNFKCNITPDRVFETGR